MFDHARTAICALLIAYGRPGDVLMPAYNCIVVPEAIQSAGYRPLFVDIDLRTLNWTRDGLRRSLTPTTTAVMATHLFGMPCDLDEAASFGREHGLLVVEDAAAAIGAEYREWPVGTIGDASVISFQATKVISGEGGGALLTNDDGLATNVSRLLGSAKSARSRWLYLGKAALRRTAVARGVYPLVLTGNRAIGKEIMIEAVSPAVREPEEMLRRCAPFSSALALAQIDRLPENLRRRRQVAEIYASGLAGHPDITLPKVTQHGNPSWIQYPVMVEDKRALYRYLQQHGIDSSWTYRYSCAESYGLDGFPGSSAAARCVLGLSTYPSLSDDEARYICHVAMDYSRDRS